ncbi:MAG TPA: hypothetical protein VGT44_02385, partial [Ktedonobacteraceae bacterium]|nr:hypothetical protein [Ktedonobacteraceae bacterium]
SGIEALLLLGRTAAHMQALLDHLRALAAAMNHPPSIMGALLPAKQQGQQFMLYNESLSGGDETMWFLSSADVLVNATSVGLKADDADTTRLLIDVNALPATTLVMDMIFNPPQTALLRAAHARGCATLNGLSMLLYQGALAFELWTGRAAPIEAMRKALGIFL